jgi:hypothetical protein
MSDPAIMSDPAGDDRNPSAGPYNRVSRLIP